MKVRACIVLWVLVFYVNLHPALAQETATYFPTDHWRTSTPEREGMDLATLAGTVNFLAKQNKYRMHSFLVIRNGYVVTDAYYYPYASGELHDLASVTKSITATLVGIAVQQGYFKGVEQRIGDITPVPEDKAEITLEEVVVA